MQPSHGFLMAPDARRPKICDTPRTLPSKTLIRHRDEAHAVIRRHRASNPRLFGSAARGQDSADSDLDSLVNPAPGMSLFDLGKIIMELESLFGVKVDVTTPGGLPPDLTERLQKDLRPL